MSEIAEALRPLWVPGINAVNGPLYSTLGDWLTRGEYQIFQPFASGTAFSVYVPDPADLLKAFAFDLDRLACASFESLLLAQKSIVLPRSTGWLFIKSYYAAFFAAHALMRLTKVSCTQIDQSAARAINKVAKLYGADNGLAISAGTYRCTYDPMRNELSCHQIATGGGSHEAVWEVFANHIKLVSSDILQSGLAAITQPVSAKLIELRGAILRDQNHSGWLSGLRNRINYRQSFGCWFPYVHALRRDKTLHEEHQLWLRDPLGIRFDREAHGDELLQAQRVCQFIVALCRVELADLANRCPTGKSFCETGSAAILKQVAPQLALATRKLAR